MGRAAISASAPPAEASVSGRSGPFAAWERRPLSLAEFRALDAPGTRLGAAQLLHLLEYSLLAPSTHNSVPQAYRLDPERGRIGIYLRRRYVLPASDPSGEEALISVGCALENLATAARAYGSSCLWRAAPELSWAGVLASAGSDEVSLGWVELTPGEPSPDEAERQALLANLLDCRSVRAEFDGAEHLPDGIRAALAACVAAETLVRLDIFESAREKFAWGKLEETALKNKLEERPFQRELGSWLLPNQDTESSRGMRGREFGLDDQLTLEVSAELRGELPMAADRLAFMARGSRHGLCTASAVCVISCLEPHPAAAVHAGRLFQRCNLMARARGLASAVHTAVCQVPHARAMGQSTLMPEGTPPSVIFRLGKPLHAADWNRSHSSRPSLKELLLADAH